MLEVANYIIADYWTIWFFYTSSERV